MKKKILVFENILKSNEYIISGLSLLDLQDVIFDIKDNNYVRIYEDIPLEDNTQKILKKCIYSEKITKRTDSFYTGDDCIILSKKSDSELYNYSCDEIFYNNIKIPNDVILIGYIHDIDWKVTIIFNDFNVLNSFLRIIYKKYKVIKEKNLDFVSD